MNIVQRLGVALKAAATGFVMSFGWQGVGSDWWGGWSNWGSWGQAGRSQGSIDYAAAVGDGRSNSMIFATLGWIGRKFPDGHLSMRRILKDGSREITVDHPFIALLRRPNDFYGGSILLVAAVWDWFISGDAYIFKVRNGMGRVIALWYAPSFLVQPVSSSSTVFVESYRYMPGSAGGGGGSTYYDLDPADVIHFRNGIDPNNVRKGLSRLACLVREIYTDDEAGRWLAAILKNSGIPGVIISPDTDDGIDPDEAESVKKTYMERFGGANRGAPLVMTGKTKIDKLSFTPLEMDLTRLRRIPEERVAAVLGVPAVVVGLGAGLDRATFANLANLREAAVEDTLLPMFRVFAEELAAQLLPDFESAPSGFEVYFDTSDIRELQPDLDKLVEREALKLRSGGITVNEFRNNIGEDSLDNGDVIYIPVNVVPTPMTEIIAPMAIAPAPARVVTAGLLASPETKALGVMQTIVRLRGRLLDPETRALAGMLRRQIDYSIAVLADVTKGLDLADVETKETDPAVFQARLEARLRATFEKGTQSELERIHLRAALQVHDVVAEWAGVDLPVDARLRQRYLRDAGKNVTGIADYTLDSLNKTIRASVFAGESLEETAARIRGLHVFSDARAATIAVTELADASNRAALVSYDAAGITHARCHDGTDHDEPCRSLNGQVFTIEEAQSLPTTGHPRCVRSWEALARAEARSGLSNGHVDHKELVAA